ncbi:excalibur calcium-binding domain-containing protein, partial [Cellulomonas humilata]
EAEAARVAAAAAATKTTTKAPTSAAATAPTSAPAPAAAPPASSGSTVVYKSCADVRAAGAAPLHAGQPGYSSKLDRDGDGIACAR